MYEAMCVKFILEQFNPFARSCHYVWMGMSLCPQVLGSQLAFSLGMCLHNRITLVKVPKPHFSGARRLLDHGSSSGGSEWSMVNLGSILCILQHPSSLEWAVAGTSPRGGQDGSGLLNPGEDECPQQVCSVHMPRHGVNLQSR